MKRYLEKKWMAWLLAAMLLLASLVTMPVGLSVLALEQRQSETSQPSENPLGNSQTQLSTAGGIDEMGTITGLSLIHIY